MAHWNQILDYINEHGSITQQEAYHFKPHGCVRLPARINDLRNRGYAIKTVRETKKYDDGATVTYARYYMEVESNGTNP